MIEWNDGLDDRRPAAARVSSYWFMLEAEPVRGAFPLNGSVIISIRIFCCAKLGEMNVKVSNKVNGLALAAAAAVVFMVAAPVGVASASSKVACAGVNACKGHGSCKGESNSCKGQNSCKGKGFVKLTKSECDQVGGTVAAPATK